MELIARFFVGMTVYVGWLAAPIHSALSYLPNKLLPKPKQPNILNLSAVELAEKIRKREVSSEQVVRAFVERCRDVNGQLNAIVEDRFLAALEDAKRVDAFVASGQKSAEQLEKETPLLGVPVTVKEACKLQGLSHCVGSKIRVGELADEDGVAVANLRNAGAIPLAVTNTPELCASVETFNFVTGYTANPYDLSRTSGGSSGGEAALISSGSSPLGIGSDFAGSIRVPCLFTGIFGHKPSPGIISNEGHYPNVADKEFQKLLTLGPMSRYAKDLKLGLRVMAGDNASVFNLDTPVDVRNLKIYYSSERRFSFTEVSVDADIKRAIKSALAYFESDCGCEVIELDLPQLKDCIEMCVMQSSEIENVARVFYLKGDELRPRPNPHQFLPERRPPPKLKTDEYSQPLMRSSLRAILDLAKRKPTLGVSVGAAVIPPTPVRKRPLRQQFRFHRSAKNVGGSRIQYFCSKKKKKKKKKNRKIRKVHPFPRKIKRKRPQQSGLTSSRVSIPGPPHASAKLRLKRRSAIVIRASRLNIAKRK